MNILHIVKSLGRGGAETLLAETQAFYNKENFSFHYIYFLPWKDQMRKSIEQNGGNVVCFPASNNIQLLFQRNKIAKYIQEHNIDLVHAHLPWAGFIARFLPTSLSVPVLYTEHNKQERYHFITRKINKYTFNKQDLAIAVSEEVKDSIQKNIHPIIPVQTILNGVDTRHFQRNETVRQNLRQTLGISPDAVVVGTLGVFRSQKRLDRWLELISRFHSKFPNIRGILAGDGPLMNELADKRKILGLEEVVIMPGLQTNAVDWYSAMDIFMMTSEFEGLPLALLEAMSCQLPVIATAAGGIKEVVRNGQEGFLTEIANWRQLEEPLANLIADHGKRTRMGSVARQRVVEHFSIATMVHQLEDLYESYVHKSRD